MPQNKWIFKGVDKSELQIYECSSCGYTKHILHPTAVRRNHEGITYSLRCPSCKTKIKYENRKIDSYIGNLKRLSKRPGMFVHKFKCPKGKKVIEDDGTKPTE